MDYTKQITETEAGLMVERALMTNRTNRIFWLVLMTNRIFWLADDLEKAILAYITPMLDRETARKFNNYANYIENMRKEVKKEFQNAFIDLKAEMNFDRANG